MIKKNTVEIKPLVDGAIDCDQVFARLTAGPFPQDDVQDDLVQWHLRCCHECRSLAEAMRPAIGLFHEAIAEQARVDLPVVTRALPVDERVRVAVRQTMQRTASLARSGDRDIEFELPAVDRRRRRIAFAVAFSLLLLVAFAGGFRLYPLLDLSPSQIVEQGADQPRHGTLLNLREPDQAVNRTDIEPWIESVGCRQASGEMRAIFAVHNEGVTCSLLKSICCAECHASAAEVQVALNVDQVASLVQACGKCHDWSN